jgi:hypothetical protein
MSSLVDRAGGAPPAVPENDAPREVNVPTAGSSGSRIPAEEPENLEELRFQVVDKDTGEVFRIDEWQQPDYTTFFLPSRDELSRRLATTPKGQQDSDDEGSKGECRQTPWITRGHLIADAYLCFHSNYGVMS